MNTYIKRNVDHDEISFNLLFSDNGISPLVLSYNKRRGIIELDRYDMTYGEYYDKFGEIPQYIEYQIDNLIYKLHNMRFIHGDLHDNNVVFKLDEDNNIIEVKLIDFGYIRRIDELDNEDINQIKEFWGLEDQNITIQDILKHEYVMRKF